jgi:hypothetical protein
MSTPQVIDCFGGDVVLLHQTADDGSVGARMVLQTGDDGMTLEWYDHDHDGPPTKHITLTYDEWRQLIMDAGTSEYLI